MDNDISFTREGLFRRLRFVFIGWLGLAVFAFLYDNGIRSVNDLINKLSSQNIQAALSGGVVSKISLSLSDGRQITADILEGNISDSSPTGLLTLQTDSGEILTANIDLSLINLGNQDFEIEDYSITAIKLAPDSVTDEKIEENTISGIKIIDGTITGGKLTEGIIVTQYLGDNAVTSIKIKDGAITTEKLLDKVVITEKLADVSVTEIKLADGSVVTGKISDLAVTGDKIANATITDIQLADGAVITAKVTDGAITEIKLSDGSVSLSKLSGVMCLTGEILKKNGSNWECAPDIGSTGFVATVTDGNGITNTGTVTDPILNANTDNVTIEITADAIQLKDGGVTSAKILDGTIVNNDIAALAGIEWSKIDKAGSNLTDIATRNFSDLLNRLAQYVDVTDAGNYFTATDTEGTLQEIGGNYFKNNGNSFGTSAIIGTNDNNSFGIETNGTTKLTVLADGNVGIGTTSPLSKLQVGGTGNIALMVNSDNSGSASVLLSAANPAGLKTDPVNARLQILAGSTEKVSVLTTGNVGIGITSPSGKLHSYVSNSAVTAASYNGYFENLATNTTTDGINKYGLYVTSTGSFTGAGGTATNNYGLYVNTPTGADNNYAAVFTGGNVGIGTTSPLATLDISGLLSLKGIPTPSIGSVFPATLFSWYDTSRDQGVIMSSDIGAVNKQLEIGASTLLFATSVAGNVLDGTSNIRMIINSAGNVGIGTTSPNYKLDIGALAGSDSTFALSDADVTHGLTTIATTETYGLFQPLSSTAGGVQFTALSDTDAQALSLRGIIGSTNPTDTTPAVSFTAGISNGTTGIAALGAAETAFQWKNNTTNLLTILGSGNVGIGTTTPTAQLHINYTGTTLPTNGLSYINWNPASATSQNADIFTINTTSLGATTGDLFQVQNNGADLFSVSQNLITSSLPHAFNSPGDVAVAYDINFTNSTASFIKSNATMYLQSGEIFNSSDLVFRTFNSGGLVFDSPGGFFSSQAQTWSLASSAVSALNINSGLLNFDTQNSRLGIGNTTPAALLAVGSTSQFQINSTGAIAAATGITSSGTITFSSLTGCASGLQTDGSGIVSCLPSDISVKNSIEDITTPLEKILGLHGVSYKWNDTGLYGTGTEFGLIAQEVELIAPELVFTMGTGIKGVKYNQLGALLVEAVKAQNTEIENIKASINLDPVSSPLIAEVNLEQEFAKTQFTNFKVKKIEVNEEILASLINVTGEANFFGEVNFNNNVEFRDSIILSKNNAGKITSTAGSDTFEFVFAKPFSATPVLTLSPIGGYLAASNISWWIESVSPSGFILKTGSILVENVEFSWIAVETTENLPFSYPN